MTSWTCELASRMLTLGGDGGGRLNGGQSLEYKQRLGTIKTQKPAWQGFAGSLMAEMEQNQYCEYLDC